MFLEAVLGLDRGSSNLPMSNSKGKRDSGGVKKRPDTVGQP
jgi:hypothetical protein